MIGQIEDHRAETEAVCRQYGVLYLELFGTAATGASNPEPSGLDFIATFADTQKAGYAKRDLHFAEALEVLFGRSVDLITDGSIRNPYFQEEVDETRQPVYRALSALAAA